MKITSVEAIYLRQPEVKFQCDSGQDALIVRVKTDAGITGIGEVDSNPMAVKGAIEGPFSHTTACGLGQVVIGEDPFETERLWHKMYRANIYGGRRGAGLHAISGIDIALWDIKGKALGLPIWKLLGGGFHKKMRCYASSLFGATPEKTGELARRYRDQGFTAVKFVWDSKTALQRARAFAEYDIFWLEEPLRPDDYEGYRKLARATEVRIAAGEEESNRASFLELMDRGGIDVVQVDLTRCGGFTEAIKIAALAWDRGLPVANHGFTTYVNVTAALHFLNSIPNALICEFVAEEETNLRESITKQKLRAKDGYLAIPDAPGLGIDLDEKGMEKYVVA